jgi:hypothetical protein
LVRQSPLERIYRNGCLAFGGLVWAGTYIYFIASFGLLGLLLGHVPAVLIALLVCWMWRIVPVLAVLLAVAARG